MTSAVRPYLIAITGGSGSGKSTLARGLQDRMGPKRCALLTEDNYYLPRSAHGPDAHTWSNETVEARINFDDPASKDMALFAAHLDQLRQGLAIRQPVYDFATHDRRVGEWRDVPATPLVIVEGVHVLSDRSLRPRYDVSIYVDTETDVRLLRRIRRDVEERGRSLPRAIDQYLRFVRAAHLRFTQPAKAVCDLVLEDSGAGAGDVLEPVWRWLAARGAPLNPAETD
ncbi:uridine kinase [bacterium]|nr:uridine kinase [bacterium]